MKDKKIKSYFENRTIEPSADAWVKMSAILDKQQPRNRSLIYLIGICSIVILGVSFFIYSKANQVQLKNYTHYSHQSEVNNSVSPEESFSTKDQTQNFEILEMDKNDNLGDKQRNNISTEVNTKPTLLENMPYIKVKQPDAVQKVHPEKDSIMATTSEEQSTVMYTSIDNQATKKYKVDALSLLEEVLQELEEKTYHPRSKYFVDTPDSRQLLQEIETNSPSFDFKKLFKQLSKSSDQIIAKINNRNYE